MSRYEFKLPDIGEGVTEGEVVAWHVKPGDAVKEDQPLLDVMTDKATVTITSPRTGTIAETRGAVGEVVKVHSVLVVYDLGGAPSATASSAPSGPTSNEPAPSAPSAESAKAQGPAATAVGDIKESLPGMGPMRATAGASAPVVPVVKAYEAPDGKVLTTPATRRIARELGVKLTRVPPTGTRGRVTPDDVRNFATAQKGASAHSAAPAPVQQATQQEAPSAASAPRAPSAAPAPSAPLARGGLEERIPIRGLRRKIAEKMHVSKTTAAHFTFVEECDCTALKALRERLKPKADAMGVKLTYLPFIAKAVVAALKKHPMLNSAHDAATDEIVVRKYYNLGIATASEQGLVVPVVKHADQRSLVELSREIERVSSNVRAGKSQLDDLQGGTFTITSLGQQGGLFATPIINYPEVAILGVHQMKQKPVVRDGQIVIGDVMLLSLSFDHRIIDGHIGAAFAYEIINYLQDPDRLMLEA